MTVFRIFLANLITYNNLITFFLGRTSSSAFSAKATQTRLVKYTLLTETFFHLLQFVLSTSRKKSREYLYISPLLLDIHLSSTVTSLSIFIHRVDRGEGGSDGAVAREYLSPVNVAWLRAPASTPYVGWVYRWFSSLLREVLVRAIRFSTPFKKQHFQIPVRFGKCLQLVRDTNRRPQVYHLNHALQCLNCTG